VRCLQLICNASFNFVISLIVDLLLFLLEMLEESGFKVPVKVGTDEASYETQCQRLVATHSSLITFHHDL